MKKELIVQLHASFEQLVHREEESGVEFWLARDLQEVLGYQTWRSFEQVVEKAVTACENVGLQASDHFARNQQNDPPWDGCGAGSERLHAHPLCLLSDCPKRRPDKGPDVATYLPQTENRIIEQAAEMERVERRSYMSKGACIIFERSAMKEFRRFAARRPLWRRRSR